MSQKVRVDGLAAQDARSGGVDVGDARAVDSDQGLGARGIEKDEEEERREGVPREKERASPAPLHAQG